MTEPVVSGGARALNALLLGLSLGMLAVGLFQLFQEDTDTSTWQAWGLAVAPILFSLFAMVASTKTTLGEKNGTAKALFCLVIAGGFLAYSIGF
jgi:hypothetical protein